MKKNKRKVVMVRMDDVNLRMRPLGEEIQAAVERVIAGGQYEAGREVEALEKEVAAYIDTTAAVSCASGDDGILLALMAAGVGPGDGVLTSPFSEYAVAGAIHRLGAIPVFLDITPTSYHMEAEYLGQFLEGKHHLNKKLGFGAERVKAIIADHTFGEMCDMAPFIYYEEDYGITVIEYAGAGFGTADVPGKAGSVGTLGCFRFPAEGGLGEVGMITTDDEKLAKTMRALRDGEVVESGRSFGSAGVAGLAQDDREEDKSTAQDGEHEKKHGFKFDIIPGDEAEGLDIAGDKELKFFNDLIRKAMARGGDKGKGAGSGGSFDLRRSLGMTNGGIRMTGGGSRISELQAAVLRVKLKKMQWWMSYRQDIAGQYNDLIEEAGLLGDWKVINAQQYIDSNLNGESLKSHRDKIFVPFNIAAIVEEEVEQAYTQFVVRTAARRELIQAFERHGIDYRIPVPEPLHLMEAFQRWEYDPWDCPNACRCSSTTISLPIYPMMSDEQVQRVVEVMGEGFN